MGESGCGKSTLGRGLIGLLPEGSARDGELRFRGTDMLQLKPKEQHAMRGRDLGMVFQEPLTRLNPLMRISEHFSETLKTHDRSISKGEIERRSFEVLRVMGIPPTRYHAYPHEFSGGMRQRLMIALTLVLRPAFVVADEPTTALDVLVEAQIIRILHDLRSNYGTALLLITHNLGIIAEACDRVAVMYAGEIVEIGDAREVFSRPKHPYTRELLRSTISLRTTGLNYIDGAPPDLVEPPSGCHFHPRCPDAMKVCATRHPVEREHDGRHPGPVLGRRLQGRPGGRRTRSPNAHRSSGRRSPLPTKPEVDRLSGPRSDTVLDIDDLAVHFQLQGGALSRMLGLKARSVKAVDGVTVSLQRGEVLGLVGESGSGKSTFGRALLGLVPATHGRITYHSEDRGERRVSEMRGAELRQLRTDLQMVFQDPHAALNPSMTIEEAVGHPLVIHKIASGKALRIAGRGRPRARRARAGRAVPHEVPLGPVRRSEAARRHRAGDHPRTRRCSSPTSRSPCST